MERERCGGTIDRGVALVDAFWAFSLAFDVEVSGLSGDVCFGYSHGSVSRFGAFGSVLQPFASKFLRRCMRRRTRGLQVRRGTHGHAKTQGMSVCLGAKFGSKYRCSRPVPLNSCVRTHVCGCVVSKGRPNEGKRRGGSDALPTEEWRKWRAVELAEEDVAVETVIVGLAWKLNNQLYSDSEHGK